MITAAEALAAQLESYGVRYVFGTCGHTNIALLDALSRSTIRFVIARHEQAAAHAADGYARASGRPGFGTEPTTGTAAAGRARRADDQRAGADAGALEHHGHLPRCLRSPALFCYLIRRLNHVQIPHGFCGRLHRRGRPGRRGVQRAGQFVVIQRRRRRQHTVRPDQDRSGGRAERVVQ
jgi:hypothetical protein